MASDHYSRLRSSITSLRQHLLPQRFKFDGSYRPSVFTKVLAFGVLSHAALEEYVENRVIEAAQSAVGACKTKGIVTPCAASLLAFGGVAMTAPPPTLVAPQPSQKDQWKFDLDIRERVIKCGANFIRNVKVNNHGIKEKHILSMLLPVGVPSDCIDPVLLSELETFGELRGAYAHQTPDRHVTMQPNPEEELERVRRIVKMFYPIDGELSAIIETTKK